MKIFDYRFDESHVIGLSPLMLHRVSEIPPSVKMYFDVLFVGYKVKIESVLLIPGEEKDKKRYDAYKAEYEEFRDLVDKKLKYYKR